MTPQPTSDHTFSRDLGIVLGTPPVPPAPVLRRLSPHHPVSAALNEVGLGYYMKPEIELWRKYAMARTIATIWRTRMALMIPMALVIMYFARNWLEASPLIPRAAVLLVASFCAYTVAYYFGTVRREASWDFESMLASEIYPGACDRFAASQHLRDTDGTALYRVSAPALLRRAHRARPVASYLELHWLGTTDWPPFSLVVDYGPKIVTR